MISFSIEVETNIDIPKHLNKIHDQTFWKFASTTWWKLYSPYIPRQIGNLMQQVVISPGEIEHTVPYAKVQYKFNNNPRKDQNRLASKEWDKAAMPTQQEKLIEAMQKYVDSGKLKL